MTEIVENCTIGIDLHTGSNHRINLPQLGGHLQTESVPPEFHEQANGL
jgi:hypothetical protein